MQLTTPITIILFNIAILGCAPITPQKVQYTTYEDKIMQKAIEYSKRMKVKSYEPSKKLVNECYKFAVNTIPWKDRSSVRLEGNGSGLVTTLDGVEENTVMVRLNAKNSFGAYVGTRVVSCEIKNNRVISAK